MKQKYDEERFGVVMEEIRDALAGIEMHLRSVDAAMHALGECVDFGPEKPVLRVADIAKDF